MINTIIEYKITDYGLYIECKFASDKENVYCYLFDNFYGWAKKKAGKTKIYYAIEPEIDVFNEKLWLADSKNPMEIVRLYLTEKINNFNMSKFLINKIKYYERESNF